MPLRLSTPATLSSRRHAAAADIIFFAAAASPYADMLPCRFSLRRRYRHRPCSHFELLCRRHAAFVAPLFADAVAPRCPPPDADDAAAFCHALLSLIFRRFSSAAAARFHEMLRRRC